MEKKRTEYICHIHTFVVSYTSILSSYHSQLACTHVKFLEGKQTFFYTFLYFLFFFADFKLYFYLEVKNNLRVCLVQEWNKNEGIEMKIDDYLFLLFVNFLEMSLKGFISTVFLY